MVSVARGVLEKGMVIPGLSSTPLVLPTFESNVLFILRFMVDCKVCINYAPVLPAFYAHTLHQPRSPAETGCSCHQALGSIPSGACRRARYGSTAQLRLPVSNLFACSLRLMSCTTSSLATHLRESTAASASFASSRLTSSALAARCVLCARTSCASRSRRWSTGSLPRREAGLRHPDRLVRHCARRAQADHQERHDSGRLRAHRGR